VSSRRCDEKLKKTAALREEKRFSSKTRISTHSSTKSWLSSFWTSNGGLKRFWRKEIDKACKNEKKASSVFFFFLLNFGFEYFFSQLINCVFFIRTRPIDHCFGTFSASQGLSAILGKWQNNDYFSSHSSALI